MYNLKLNYKTLSLFPLFFQEKWERQSKSSTREKDFPAYCIDKDVARRAGRFATTTGS